MNTTPRDPHLPPPAVVDWLLEQKWSERISSIEMSFSENRPFGISHSEMNGYHVAHTAIGRDETARLFIPDDALEALRKDQDNRRAPSATWAAFEEKRQGGNWGLRIATSDDLARKWLREQERACEADELAIKAKRWSREAAEMMRQGMGR